MSPVFATAIALLLYAVATIPLGLIAARWGSARGISIGFCAAIGAFAFAQTGVLQRGQLTSADVPQQALAGLQSSRCDRIYDILSDAGVLLEAPSSQGLTVQGSRWDQLPQPIRDAVVTCARESAALDSATDEIEIIRR